MGLAFTFFDRSYNRSLTDPDIDNIVEKSRHSAWGVLIDDKLYCAPGDELCHQERQGKPGESYCTFYAADYMASLFPDGEIRLPVRAEWQHCCILRNSPNVK